MVHRCSKMHPHSCSRLLFFCYTTSLFFTCKSFKCSDRSDSSVIVQTMFRLLLKERPGQGLHCLSFGWSLWTHLHIHYAEILTYSNFRNVINFGTRCTFRSWLHYVTLFNAYFLIVRYFHSTRAVNSYIVHTVSTVSITCVFTCKIILILLRVVYANALFPDQMPSRTGICSESKMFETLCIFSFFIKMLIICKQIGSRLDTKTQGIWSEFKLFDIHAWYDSPSKVFIATH